MLCMNNVLNYSKNDCRKSESNAEAIYEIL